MKVTDRIHLVGSGKSGFSLTDPFDCHVYLLDGGDELALVDSGAGMGWPMILAEIRRAGFEPRRIRQLLLTHAHGDHAGGAAAVKEALDVHVTASPEAAGWVRSGDEDAISIGPAKIAGIYPSDYRFRACPVETEVREGDRIRVGNLELEVFETPGHSRGHVSYLLREGGKTYLLAGDAIFAGGRVVLQGTWDCSIQDSIATIRKLAALQFDSLLAGHGPFVMSNARVHLDRAMTWVDRLLPPPQLEA